MNQRLTFTDVLGSGSKTSFCAEVDAGLSQPQKTLPTHYLYDHDGSELFEAITELPEYYLTRCETEILEAHASDIVRACPGLTTIVEFGSGSSKKTRLILDAAIRARGELTYVPIDISAEFLQETAASLLERFPPLRISAIAGEYFEVAAALPPAPGPRLILFLGSNVGNLTADQATRFLGSIQKRMTQEDRLLVGIDLVKDPAIITAAYNDPAGVTARFNLNLLARINRDLDGQFDLARFRHDAPFLEDQRRVEMRLYSEVDQVVEIDAIGKQYAFAEGEFIHTEWSQKYTLESFEELAGSAGLAVADVWYDQRRWFGFVTLKRQEAL